MGIAGIDTPPPLPLARFVLLDWRNISSSVAAKLYYNMTDLRSLRQCMEMYELSDLATIIILHILHAGK